MEATKAGGVTSALELAAGMGARTPLGAVVGVASAACGKGCVIMAPGVLPGFIALIMVRLAFLIIVLGCADGLACARVGLTSIAGF
jgi:hypothetical protein